MAGAFDDYAEALRLVPGAVVDPLFYRGEDGTGTEPYRGTFGHFDAHAAMSIPLAPANPDYVGDLPLKQQQAINVPDPWVSDVFTAYTNK